jgi:hypothetical protein
MQASISKVAQIIELSYFLALRGIWTSPAQSEDRGQVYEKERNAGDIKMLLFWEGIFSPSKVARAWKTISVHMQWPLSPTQSSTKLFLNLS